MWDLDELKAFVISERIEMLLQEQKRKFPKSSKEEIEILTKLYTQGFCDGVKIVNGLNQLNKIK